LSSSGMYIYHLSPSTTALPLHENRHCCFHSCFPSSKNGTY
jgi:hypothetical protein